MKITFLGTSSCESVPGIFCNCDFCTQLRKRIAAGEENAIKTERTRTQTLIDDKILVDIGPDTYHNALKNGLNLSRLTHVLQTHSHEDHFIPQELYLRRSPYAHGLQGEDLSLVGSTRIGEMFNFFATLFGEGQKGVSFQLAKPLTPVKMGEYTVTALPSLHMATEDTFVYLIEKGKASHLVCNDTGILPEETFNYLVNWAKTGKTLSSAALECPIGESSFQYKWHLNFSQVVEMIRRFKETGIASEQTLCYVNHISQEYEDKYYKEYCAFAKDYGILVPYDGLSIELKED